MYRILIVEDEAIASQHLSKLLKEVVDQPTAITVVQTVEEGVSMLSTLQWWMVFMDIHLADGLAFRIFDRVQPRCPVVFTTAYDQYALDAFRAGGYDYLLKPIDPDDLRRAIRKCGKLKDESGKMKQENDTTQDGDSSLSTLHPPIATRYRTHFLIPTRDKLIPIEVKQIAYFYLEDKITRAVLFDGRKQIVDRPLDSIMDYLDPTCFFRANRQYIVSHDAIREIGFWPVSKLVLTLVVDTPERIIISKARTSEFKDWYTQ